MGNYRLLQRLVLTLPLAVGACQQGAQVDVRQIGGTAIVEVGREGKPACIDRLNVIAGEPDGGPPAWFIIATLSAICVTRVTLGQVPPGFESAPPTPFLLTAGTRHLVEVTGPAFIGSTRFIAAVPPRP